MSVRFDERRPPRIGLISVSTIADDPRVRRQGDLFRERGWDVVAIGLPGALSPAPAWPCLSVGTREPASTAPDAVDVSKIAAARDVGGNGKGEVPGTVLRAWRRRSPPLESALLRSFLISAQRRLRRAKDVAGVYLEPARAISAYWGINDRFNWIYRLASGQSADIWLANDWTALPIVQRLATEQGVPYAYDTHELAVDEYAQSWRWRLIHRPVIAAVERMGTAGAVVTSCVSQGIADRLHQLYDLPEKPLLIRNMPRYEAHPFRPCGDRIAVLYHGVVNAGRGLEACIASVSSWRPEFHLTIRGPGPAAYIEGLAARIRSAGLDHRVTLAPPVPMIDLVKEAARFDVGLFALPGHSKQNVHVLPNKFFEYTMAGLALCVSDLPEMTALLRQHDLGRSIPDVTPQAIAAAINGFDRGAIDACKQRALEAAKMLNWEAEADRLFAAIEQAVAGTAGVRQLAAQRAGLQARVARS